MTACRPSTSTMPPMKLAASKVFLWGSTEGATVVVPVELDGAEETDREREVKTLME